MSAVSIAPGSDAVKRKSDTSAKKKKKKKRKQTPSAPNSGRADNEDASDDEEIEISGYIKHCIYNKATVAHVSTDTEPAWMLELNAMVTGCTLQLVEFALSLETINKYKSAYSLDNNASLQIQVRVPSVSPMFEWRISVDMKTRKQIGPFKDVAYTLGFLRMYNPGKKSVPCTPVPFGSVYLTRNHVALMLSHNRIQRGGTALDRTLPGVKKLLSAFPVSIRLEDSGDETAAAAAAAAENARSNPISRAAVSALPWDASCKWIVSTLLNHAFCPKEYFYLRVIYTYDMLVGLGEHACVQLWKLLLQQPYLVCMPTLLAKYLPQHSIQSFNCAKTAPCIEWLCRIGGAQDIEARVALYAGAAAVYKRLVDAERYGNQVYSVVNSSQPDAKAGMEFLCREHAGTFGRHSFDGWVKSASVSAEAGAKQAWAKVAKTGVFFQTGAYPSKSVCDALAERVARSIERKKDPDVFLATIKSQDEKSRLSISDDTISTLTYMKELPLTFMCCPSTRTGLSVGVMPVFRHFAAQLAAFWARCLDDGAGVDAHSTLLVVYVPPSHGWLGAWVRAQLEAAAPQHNLHAAPARVQAAFINHSTQQAGGRAAFDESYRAPSGWCVRAPGGAAEDSALAETIPHHAYTRTYSVVFCAELLASTQLGELLSATHEAGWRCATGELPPDAAAQPHHVVLVGDPLVEYDARRTWFSDLVRCARARPLCMLESTHDACYASGLRLRHSGNMQAVFAHLLDAPCAGKRAAPVLTQPSMPKMADFGDMMHGFGAKEVVQQARCAHEVGDVADVHRAALCVRAPGEAGAERFASILHELRKTALETRDPWSVCVEHGVQGNGNYQKWVDVAAADPSALPGVQRRFRLQHLDTGVLTVGDTVEYDAEPGSATPALGVVTRLVVYSRSLEPARGERGARTLVEAVASTSEVPKSVAHVDFSSYRWQHSTHTKIVANVASKAAQTMLTVFEHIPLLMNVSAETVHHHRIGSRAYKSAVSVFGHGGYHMRKTLRRWRNVTVSDFGVSMLRSAPGLLRFALYHVSDTDPRAFLNLWTAMQRSVNTLVVLDGETSWQQLFRHLEHHKRQTLLNLVFSAKFAADPEHAADMDIFGGEY